MFVQTKKHVNFPDDALRTQFNTIPARLAEVSIQLDESRPGMDRHFRSPALRTGFNHCIHRKMNGLLHIAQGIQFSFAGADGLRRIPKGIVPIRDIIKYDFDLTCVAPAVKLFLIGVFCN